MSEGLKTEIAEQVAERVAEEAADLTPPKVERELSTDFVLDCLKANERGDGVLFAELHRDKFIYNNTAGRWLFFNGHHWEWDVMGNHYGAVEDVARRYESELPIIDKRIRKAKSASGDDEEEKETFEVKRLRGIKKKMDSRIDRLRSDRGITACIKAARQVQDENGNYPMAVFGNEFDKNPWLLACPNGVINLKNGRLMPGRPDDYLIRSCNTPYEGLNTPAPLLESFLKEIQPDRPGVPLFLARIFGYGITGLNIEHDFYCFYGPRGRNGKGTLIEVIKHILGELAGPIPTELLMDQGRVANPNGPAEELLDLKGLRVAWASETERGQRFSAGHIKKYTGGDSLKARGNHAKGFSTWEPTHTLYLLTNDRPSVHGDDEAFWARFKMILFPVHYVKDRAPDPARLERSADKHLKKKLLAEASGILSWLVRGCLDWQKQGLNPPPEILNETRGYQEDEDIVLKWIRECCDTSNPEASTQASELYGNFCTWFTKSGQGKKPWGSRTYYEALARKHEKVKKTAGNFYNGIWIKTTFESPYGD